MSCSKVLLQALALGLFAATAQAQVFGIWLTDTKAEKKFAKHITRIGSEAVIVCEPCAGKGIVHDADKGQINYSRERNEVFVADPSDPSWVPYTLEGDERKPNGSKATLGVQGKYIKKIQILMPHQSLFGLSREYGRRRALVEELRAARDSEPKGGAEWMRQELRMLSAYERLRTWLVGTAYTKAGEELAEEIEKERKRSKAEAVEARLERALASIAAKETPAELVQASQVITGGKVEFGLSESEHVRIVYDLSGVTREEVAKLLRFAENAIDGFRRDFVDPYLAEDFPDHIPDRLFVEFWIGPDDLAWHERFYVDYYKLTWGQNKDQRLAVRGATKRRPEPPEFLDYGKREDHNLMGVVAHRIGHVLADLHFNANQPGMKHDWLGEAAAYHISLEYFGRNDESCFAFQEKERYGGGTQTSEVTGVGPLLLGERFFYHQLALEKGRSFHSLAPMTIYSMSDSDFAKGWSFFDYIARCEGRRGQEWLREGCRQSQSKWPGFINPWRESSAALFEVEASEVFTVLEERWRESASREQEVGLPKRD
jgi:hypothetical protein